MWLFCAGDVGLLVTSHDLHLALVAICTWLWSNGNENHTSKSDTMVLGWKGWSAYSGSEQKLQVLTTGIKSGSEVAKMNFFLRVAGSPWRLRSLVNQEGLLDTSQLRYFLALVHTKDTLERWCLSAGLGMPHIPLNELARESETWATLLQLLPLQTKLSDRKMETWFL